MVCGVIPVIAPATPPLLVSHPPFAFLRKERGNGVMVRATTEIGGGKAKTFPPTIILTKLPLPFMTNPLHLLPKAGGMIMN
jgi:hypothetical protein